MPIKNLIIQYLRSIGADGLVRGGCWCSIDEFEKTGCEPICCIPARKIPKDCGNCDRTKGCIQMAKYKECFIPLDPLPDVEVRKK